MDAVVAEINTDLPKKQVEEAEIEIQTSDADMQDGDEQGENDESRKKRARTENEKKEKRFEKYKCLSPCEESCRKCCRKNINDDLRESINRCYWGLPFGERRQWLSAHVHQNEITTRSKKKQKSTSLLYFLPSENVIKVQVCKTMFFLRTLGLKSDGVITELIKTKHKSIENTIAPVKDLRGRGSKTPPNKVDIDIIIENINSFKPMVSHYSLKNANRS